jgi:hypothetical protein
MPDYRAPMERTERATWWSTVVGLGACVAGLLVLLATSLNEITIDPRLSIVDGYWMGRLPWSAVGVDLAVIGATVAVVAGTVTSWGAGGRLRRVVAASALAVAAFWWFIAMMPMPGGAYCPTCAPRGPEPFTFAYSLPDTTMLFLLVPAFAVGLVALLGRRPTRVAARRRSTS